MTELVVALQFLVRLPVPNRGDVTIADFGRSMRWFPLVGAGIGLLVGAADALLAPVVPVQARSVLAVILLAAITGALHLDGLMDACDGLFAFATPERRLEIMRDSRVGSFGIVGAATILLLKFAALQSLPADRRLVAFVLMGAISRWAMVFATTRFPAARPDGLGHDFKESAGGAELAWASGWALAIALFGGPSGLAALVLAVLSTWLAARYTMTKIPGLTGDVYGAISEGTEALVALVLTPLWHALP
ncbi:MAG TPA: adenosylcobinamide-GDP ribazoletransferase [Chloroflexota bacterium]|nr:adenosylcobinamide-GDP ribazoletransferase [Chloroflexota bacterium]